MRVLVVSHLWPRADWRHLGTFVSEQVAALAEKCDVSVLIPVDQTVRREELSLHQLLAGFDKYQRRRRPELLPLSDVNISVVPFHGSVLRERFAEGTARNLSRSLSSVRLSGIDVVHAHTVFPDGLACALWLQREPIPLIVTAHGSDVHSAAHGVRKAIKLLFQRADRLIPVSRHLRDQLIRYGAPAEKCKVIPNGFPDALFKDVDIAKRNPKKIAFLGRLDDIKRVDLLIRAVAHCDRDIRLDIAGDGALRKQYEALVDKLGLSERVHFLGMIEREEVPGFLAGAGIMCLVSRREGWPTVIFEALACGTPVVATAVGGIPEALADEQLGILVPEDSPPEELAGKIRQAIQTDWDREYIRTQAFAYSWDRIAERLLGIYRSFIPDRVADASDI